MTMQSNTTYTDEYNRPSKLTDEEMQYFCETVTSVLSATGILARIAPRDHEEIPGSEEALGICWRSEDGDQFITIDNYFIHERFCIERGSWLAIENATLTDVICHELAHLRYWRHTKRHAALTAQYIAMVSEMEAMV